MRMRPTVFGLLLAAGLVAMAVTAPAVADPAVAGVVMVVLAGFAALSAIWSVATVATARLEVVDAPTDSIAGDPLSVRVRVTGGAGTLWVQPRAPVGPRVAAVGDEVELELTGPSRCVLTRVRVRVASDGPFGVLRAWRHVDLEMPVPTYVAPRPIRTSWDPDESVGAHHEAVPSGSPVGGDTVRGVRPYVPGDPAHLVHWPSSARVGELVVRELEAPVPPGLAVVVDLGSGGPQGEGAASRAAGLVAAVLQGGGRVVLCTRGPDGPDRSEVLDTVTAGRRLAAAAPGPPAEPPVGWAAERVRASATLPEPTGRTGAAGERVR